MRPLHSKKKRTTLTDAQNFIKDGIVIGMQSSDYLSDEERETIAHSIADDLLLNVKKNFPKTTNLEYAILKMHLIIEYALIQYIRCSSYVLVESDSIKFSFSQKIEIAILLGLGNGSPILIPAIELINRLRNQVAHNFIINKKLVDELIKLFSEESPVLLNNRRKIAYLRSIAEYICGAIVGSIEARIYLTSKNSLKNNNDLPFVSK